MRDQRRSQTTHMRYVLQEPRIKIRNYVRTRSSTHQDDISDYHRRNDESSGRNLSRRLYGEIVCGWMLSPAVEKECFEEPSYGDYPVLDIDEILDQ